jgi:hypothetical protein
MIDVAQPDELYHHKIDGDDVVQQLWDYHDQDSRDEGDERRNVCGSKSHPPWWVDNDLKSNEQEASNSSASPSAQAA